MKTSCAITARFDATSVAVNAMGYLSSAGAVTSTRNSRVVSEATLTDPSSPTTSTDAACSPVTSKRNERSLSALFYLI